MGGKENAVNFKLKFPQAEQTNMVMDANIHENNV
jgi:hypothetical protein